MMAMGRSALGVAVSWLVLLGLAFGGCSLPREGELSLECVADSECNDGNPCTTGRCLPTGFCEVDVLQQVELPQVAGDCVRAECVSGEVRAVPVDDPPEDDNPCTVDRCEEGAPVNDAGALEGNACQLGANSGTCEDGACLVACAADEGCDDARECTEDRCDLSRGVCVNAPLNGVVAASEAGGDCALSICQEGDVVEVVDNGDLPDDLDDCTRDRCVEGAVTYDDRPAGFDCSTNDPLAKLCDGVGTCVQCLGQSDCDHLPPSSACAERTCAAGACGQSFTPGGTPVGSQTPGDCKVTQCDGNGNVATVADAGDLPTATNCQTATCNGPNPVVTNLPQGTACGSSGVCDANGVCGQCNLPTDCGTDTECRVWQCINQACVPDDTPVGTPLTNQTMGDCLEVQCDGMGQAVSVPVDDPFDDNNECTDDICVNGVPQNPNQGTTEPCSTGFCNGGGTCVQCNNPGQCPQGDGICEVPVCAANVCSIDPQPAGTVAPMSEQTDGDCLTAVCDGAGAVSALPVVNDADVPVDAEECTQDVCTMGSPSNPLEPAGTICSTGVCSGVGSGTCVECVDDTTCASVETCDTGSFVCELNDGQPCTPGDCFSGHCIDDVCCDSSCAGTCESCDIVPGVCTLQPDGADPDLECPGADSCNGMGGCRCSDGQVSGDETGVDCGGPTCGVLCPAGEGCDGPSDCVSGVCSGGACQAPACGDGVINGTEVCDYTAANSPCCTTTCMGTAGSGTVCGIDPDATGCGAPPLCDGLGTSLANCTVQVETDGSLCTDDGLFCSGTERCQSGVCTSDGDPCDGAADGDANCQETCDEANDVCGNDPENSVCDDGVFCNGTETCTAGICGGSSGDPCPGPDGDANCVESCNESSLDCSSDDPEGALCSGGTCTGGVCTM